MLTLAKDDATKQVLTPSYGNFNKHELMLKNYIPLPYALMRHLSSNFRAQIKFVKACIQRQY